MYRRPRHSRLGLTLIEVIIGSALAVVLALGAFMFAATQSRRLGITTAELGMSQNLRSASDMLADDIRHAGVGIGYRPDGSFAGLLMGSFTAGSAAFNSRNSSIPLETGTFTTDDVGVVMADLGYATISDWSMLGVGQICSGSTFKTGDLVAVRSEDGLAARTIRLGAVTRGVGCSNGTCLGGCDGVVWTADTTYLSDAGASNISYVGGEMAGGYKTIVWFVEASDPSRAGVGALRRAVFDQSTTCSTRDYRCGALVAENIETLQMQVWEWRTDDRWSNVTASLPSAWTRIRVDLELVIRAPSTDDRVFDRVELRLEPGACLPNCSTRDRRERRVERLSLEIKNSGRTRLN